jgi:CO/xanthine dehydrogenase Mo-binding subunit
MSTTTTTTTTTSVPLTVIGTSVPRVDSWVKVTGQKQFIADVAASFPNRLYAKVLRSNTAHANITSIDTSKAKALPGVKAVITGQDYPTAKSGNDYYMLATGTAPSTPTGVIGRIMQFGQPIAAVAATSEAIAEAAVDLITYNQTLLPAIFDPATAASPTAPTTAWTLGTDVSSTTTSPRDVPRANVCGYQVLTKGNADAAMATADYVIQNTYSTPGMFHMTMEPFGAVAKPNPDGSVDVWITTDAVFSQQSTICSMLGLPQDKVRVYETGPGGSFGSKHGVAAKQVIAVALALKTNSVVELLDSREEASSIFQRPDFVVVAKDGVMKDGTIVAREYSTYDAIGGHHSGDQLLQTLKTHTQYCNKVPNYKVEAFAVYTNTPTRAAFRGFGVPEQEWALEQQMDLIAARTGVDPVQLRLKYMVQPGDLSIVGENSIQSSCGASACLTQAASAVGYGKPVTQPAAPYKRAVGVAAGNKYSPGVWGANVYVKVEPDGTIQLRSAGSDHGQGLETVLAMMVAEQFQVPMSSVYTFRTKDTFTLPNCGTSAGSTSTFCKGNSVVDACVDAKQQLFALAAPRLNVPASQLSTSNGYVFVTSNPSNKIAISSLISIGSQTDILGYGSHTITTRSSDNSYCFLGAGAVVDVNTQTGEVHLVQLVNSCDATPINPALYSGQLEAGWSQGLGIATMEEIVFDTRQASISYGRPMNLYLKQQKEPTTLDVPHVANYQTIVVSSPHPDGPYGAKGIGEGILSASCPAMANAVASIIGARIFHAPMTPAKVLAALGVIKPQPSQNAITY